MECEEVLEFESFIKYRYKDIIIQECREPFMWDIYLVIDEFKKSKRWLGTIEIREKCTLLSPLDHFIRDEDTPDYFIPLLRAWIDFQKKIYKCDQNTVTQTKGIHSMDI